MVDVHSSIGFDEPSAAELAKLVAEVKFIPRDAGVGQYCCRPEVSARVQDAVGSTRRVRSEQPAGSIDAHPDAPGGGRGQRPQQQARSGRHVENTIIRRGLCDVGGYPCCQRCASLLS